MNNWYEAFLHNPQQAISDLFSGRAGLGSSLRLDIPELLVQEFPDTAEFAQAREQLDNALLVWLSGMRRDYAAQVKRLGYAVYSKRLCDALISVQLLDLPQTTYQLRETATSWLNWLTPLRIAPERDPALEYWHVLTRRQLNDGNPALWLQLANDSRDEYLNVALKGLQRLPTNNNSQRNQQIQLLAILQHALFFADSGTAYKFFNHHFAVLRAIYPAAPQHWKDLLEAVLKNVRSDSTMAKELLEKLRLQPTSSKTSKNATSLVNVQPADKTEFDNLFHDINKSKQPAEVLAERFFKLLDKQYTYAKATGDRYFYITTLSNLGTKLLKRYQFSPATLNRLQQMIERGLSLEPMDSFIWMLWASCLACLDWTDAQQWVLRETVRLFPNDESARVGLARLLMQQGHDKEAEHWLREAVERNPNAEPSHVELARLLIRRYYGSVSEKIERYLEEAECLLLEVIEQHPENEQSHVVLAKLQTMQGKTSEAENLLTTFLKHCPRANQAFKLLNIIQSGKFMSSTWLDLDVENYVGHKTQSSSKQNDNSVQPNESLSVSTDFGFDMLTELQRRAVLQSEFNQTDNLETINREAAEGDALACFYWQWLKPDESFNPPPHAWAAQACRLYQTNASDEQWEEFTQTFPEKRLLNRFLHLQLTENEKESESLLKKLSHDAQTPLQQFIYQALQSNHSHDKDKLAFAVLASAAIDAPQFACC